MNKVLTWEEFEALEKGKTNSPAPEQKIKEPVYTESEPVPVLSDTMYQLMYPDNPTGSYHSGVYHVNGKSLDIVNGTVWTDCEKTCQILKQQGFVFMRSRAKTEEEM